MSNDDLDRILTSERDVTPSAAFARRVMSGVRREAALPPALAFPWRRIAPILVVCGTALAAAFVLFALLLTRSDAPLGALRQHPLVHVAQSLGSGGLPPLIGTLLGSWLLYGLAMRMDRPSRP